MGTARIAVTTVARGTSENKSMTPEIFFAPKLASNEKKTRDKFLKKMKKWISARSHTPDAFSDDEFLKLWKGLFYCMWMSDKPLIQEDLAETIASLVHSIVDRKTGLNFVKIGLVTMARDWSGIDTWRMDKFMMFVRRIIRHSLEYLAENSWNEEEVSIYSDMLSECIVNANKNTSVLKVPVGLQLHITSMFPEEISKAGGESITSPTIIKLLELFAKCLAISNDQRLKKQIFQHVFIYLMKQSDEGQEYENNQEEKTKYFPKLKVRKSKKKAVEDVEQEAEEVEEKEAEDDDDEIGQDDEDDKLDMDEDVTNFDWGAKDPRAGGVDVVLAQLKPDYGKMALMLLKYSSDKTIRNKNRQPLHRLVKRFQDLGKGVYPLKVALPEVGLGLTPKFMRQASRRFLRDELKMSEEKEEGKKSLKASKNALRSKRQQLEDLSENLLEENDQMIFEGEDVAHETGGIEEEEECDEDMEEEDSDEDEEEAIEDDESILSAEDKTSETLSKTVKKSDKTVGSNKKEEKEAKKSITISPVAKFEVDDDWADELPKDEPIKELKQKLKAQKRAIKSQSTWTTTLMEGETEIVIPNKKYKGAVPLKPAPEEEEETPAVPGKNRSVKFILNKNTSQKHMDYQTSLRNSPGIPHDPDRQPSGGVLKKRTSMAGSKIPLAGVQSKRNQRRSMN